MFNQADILKAIQAGQDPQEIANGFADALNAAIAEANSAAEANKIKERKIAQGKVILDLVADFIQEFYPDIYTDEMRNIKPEDLVAAFDKAYAEVQQLNPVLNDLEKLIKEMDNKKTPTNSKKIEDPLEWFLKNNNLK